MKILKINNGYFLDENHKSQYLKTLRDEVLNLLLNDIDANEINVNNGTISIVNSQQIPNIIREPNLINRFKKNIVKNIKLNLKFNKETKQFDLTNENTETFDDANTISYFTSCSDFEPDDLYFHETCLVNFFDNLLTEELKECNTFLGVMFYDEYVYDENSSNVVINTKKDQMHFYCYNKETGEIYEDESNFSELNKNSIFDFSYDYHSETSPRYGNVRRADSLFPLIHQNEEDFISFKNTVNIFLYNQFIDSLKQKAV